MSLSKKILMFLSNGFNPDPRVYKEAKSLIDNGFEVSLICWDRDCNLKLRENIDGINIYRIRTSKIISGNFKSMLFNIFKFHKKAFNLAKKLNFDAVHCHDFDTVMIGYKLKKNFKVPLVYDIHDLYESNFEKNKLFKKIIQLLDVYYCKKSDSLIIVNDAFKEKKQIKGKKIVLLMNTPLFKGTILSKNMNEGIFYAGGLQKSREMSFIFEVNKELKQKITIAGDGPLLKKYVKNYENKFNIFLGNISAKDVELRTKNCKLILAPYDTYYSNNILASPNKLFEAMKYGKPSLVSEGTVMGNIVKEENCGETFKYGSQEDFIKKFNLIEKNYNIYSKNAYSAFKKKYSWDIMIDNLIKEYEVLLK
jgi:glycosyltransferase involved in cell wall biosynthesis